MSMRVELPRLSARDRRAVMLGGALLLGAWLVTRGIPTVLRVHARALTRTAAAVHELAQARALIAGEADLRDSLGARATRLVAWAPRLMAGDTRAEAAAELTSLVSGIAAGHRVRVERLDPLPDSTAAMFVRVAVRVEATGDVRGLAGWIASLDAGERLVEVRELEISVPEPAATAAQPEILRARLVVAGWSAPRGSGRN